MVTRRAPLAARRSHSPRGRFPLAAAQFPLGTQLLRLGTRLGDSGRFQKATGVYTRATRATGGDSRNRLGARGGNSLGRVGARGGDSLAPLGPSPLARRPRRARLAPATCARRVRLAHAPLPRPAPLPPRSLPSEYIHPSVVNSRGVPYSGPRPLVSPLGGKEW